MLNQIAEFYAQQPLVRLFVAPALVTLLAYLITRRIDEFGDNALRNTAATIVLVGLNFAVLNYLLSDINSVAQAGYDYLGIPTLPEDFWQPVPFWAVLLVGVVAMDFVDYWNHRLMHTTWFWPTHAAHHSDTHVNAFTSFRVHFLEALVMSLSYVLLLTWLQMPGTIPLVVMLRHLHNLYVHANLPFQHGPFKLLVASPVFHRWHHADDKVVYGKNLANIMPVWDRLFGTYYDGGLCEAPMGALSTGIEDKNPFLIFVYPFQRWAELVRGRVMKRSARRNPEQTQTAKS